MSENSQENSGIIPEKDPAQTSNPNYTRYIKGSGYTAIPYNFFKFAEWGILKPYHFSIAVLLWHHTYNSKDRKGSYNKLFEFTLGRSELSEVAFCGKKQAREAIEVLKECGLLILIESKRGYAFTYRWNVEMLKSKNLVVPERYNQLYLPGTASCIPEVQPPVSSRYNIYIEYFIELNISSYNERAAKRRVDNSENSDSGELKGGALGAPVVGGEKVAAWIAAGKACGEAYGYHLVHLVISKYQPLYFESVNHPDILLTELVTDPGTIHELQKYNFHFADNEEFAAAMSVEFKQHLKNEITKGDE